MHVGPETAGSITCHIPNRCFCAYATCSPIFALEPMANVLVKFAKIGGTGARIVARSMCHCHPPTLAFGIGRGEREWRSCRSYYLVAHRATPPRGAAEGLGLLTQIYIFWLPLPIYLTFVTLTLLPNAVISISMSASTCLQISLSRPSHPSEVVPLELLLMKSRKRGMFARDIKHLIRSPCILIPAAFGHLDGSRTRP